METVAEAVLCSEKEPPVADTDPGFTEALEGLCAFSSPNQFSSSPEVGMWRQENGSYQLRLITVQRGGAVHMAQLWEGGY